MNAPNKHVLYTKSGDMKDVPGSDLFKNNNVVLIHRQKTFTILGYPNYVYYWKEL